MHATPWALKNCGLFEMTGVYGCAVYGDMNQNMVRFFTEWSNCIRQGISRSDAMTYLKAHRCLFSLAHQGYDLKKVDHFRRNPGIQFLLRYSKVLWQGTNTSHGNNITSILLMDLRPLVGTLIDGDGKLLPPRHMSYRFRKYFTREQLLADKPKKIYKLKRTRKSDGCKEKRVVSKKEEWHEYVNIIYTRVKDHAK
jgi:hypothetical protein